MAIQISKDMFQYSSWSLSVTESTNVISQAKAFKNL